MVFNNKNKGVASLKAAIKRAGQQTAAKIGPKQTHRSGPSFTKLFPNGRNSDGTPKKEKLDNSLKFVESSEGVVYPVVDLDTLVKLLHLMNKLKK
jgi:hypothetical protein